MSSSNSETPILSTSLFEDAVKTAKTLVPLKSLRENFLEDLFSHASVQSIIKDQVVFNEGTHDYQHVYLLSGHIELQYDNGYKEFIRARDTITPIAHQQPRPASAVTVTDSTILRIDSDRLERTLAWSEIAQYLLSDLAVDRQFDDDMDWMQTVLASNLFFKVPPINVERIYGKMKPVTVSKGEVIIVQGDIGDCCYFIKRGTADVTIRPHRDAQQIKVADITVGRCFGEDALVNETIRNATITMTSDGELMRLEKSDFQLLLNEPEVKEVTETSLSEMPDKPIFIDVRTEDEYREGHLSFSANVPLKLLAMKKRLLAKDQMYVAYCDTGVRSRAAAYLLGKEGYKIYALQGGLRHQADIEQLVAEEGYILKNGQLVEST